MPGSKNKPLNYEQQLEALNQAALAISSELTLSRTLQQIVDSLRALTGAAYAAVGVPNSDGFLDEFIYSGIDSLKAVEIGNLPHGLGLLGAIFNEKATIRIPSILDDPRSVGFPENHPQMVPFLGVPVLARGEVLGNLYLTNESGGREFTEADQVIVERFATHVAVAIQNARLYEEVGRLAIIQERDRIGMDLHDGIIQSIYAAGLILESARMRLPEGTDESEELLTRAIENLNDTIRDIRNFILDLRPRRFEGDLAEGMGRLVREFQANTMVAVTHTIELSNIKELKGSVARSFFLTIQEALANVARHAKATHVKISLKRIGPDIQLRISDDGLGFDAMKRNREVGHGLSNMRSRAASLDGSFELISAPGEGTTILLTLPYR
ncbi:MAG: GAF domain-containing sensor histidine kinase [Candidatus Promineifilaceae bacterium]